MAETTTEKSRDQQINDLATRVAQEFKTVKNNTVSVNTQTLTDAQKTQVKTNLGITDVILLRLFRKRVIVESLQDMKLLQALPLLMEPLTMLITRAQTLRWQMEFQELRGQRLFC